VPDGEDRQRILVVLAGVVVAAIVLGSVLLAARALSAASRHHPPAKILASDPAAAAAGPSAEPPQFASPGPWWQPLPAATASFTPVQLVIEKLRVRAPIEVKDVDSNNQMEAPDRAPDAAWYRFTSRPGSGSNAVFSGHRDFARVGPAIFWHLDQLVPGDPIDVVSPVQTEIRYRVSQVWSYGLSEVPMQKVLAADRTEEITLITCSGTYTPSSGYDHRLVVRAVRAA
jgi:LPXTG-site transpeptidase (sortase) family protein